MPLPDSAFFESLTEHVAVSDISDLPGQAIMEAYTQKEIGRVPQLRAEDVHSAFERARVAQKEWAATSINYRAKIVKKFANLVTKHTPLILDVIQAESGKARKYAQEEALDCSLTGDYYSRLARKILPPRGVPSSLPLLAKAKVILHPQGVIGVIAPWNFPFMLSIGDAIAALVAGNAVVLKPASSTPFSALLAARLLQEAGLPQDVLAIVTGPGRTVGQAIINEADHIVFTGSSSNGRSIAEQAAARLVEFSAELGGKNPMIITKSAKLDDAVEGAWRAAFAGAGQVCVGIERLYVEQSIYNEFLTKFIARTDSLRIKSSYEFDSDIGSLSTTEQLKTVEYHVQDAKEKGATIAAGGQARPDIGPLFYEPTILTNVTPDMQVYAHETFGPLVSVYPVASTEEAIEKANDSHYGLNACVWSGSWKESISIGQKLQVGTVNINEGYAIAWTTKSGPMGGCKQSGVGRRHGIHGLTRFTEPQTIAALAWLRFEKLPILSSDVSVRYLTAIVATVRRLPRWHREKY